MTTELLNMRDMDLDDLDKIIDIEEKTFEFPWNIDIFKSCLEYNYLCKIFENKNELIGYIIAKVVAREVDLCNIVICPSYRNKGWGKKIFHDFLLFIEGSVDVIWLEVRKSNINAIHFYENLGFKPMCIRKGYYPTKHAREDGIVYSYYLNAE
jgi:ribosomal-protein-alanine N-acetyltransferase